MTDLKLLYIGVSNECEDINWKFDKDREYLPSSLRFMRWDFFPFSSLPNTFHGKHLVYLYIDDSDIVQLWEDGEEKVLNNLRFLTISSSKLRTFDLRLAPNLQHLDLSYSNVTNLHLGNAPNLKTLDLIDCKYLVEVQMPAESLKLEHLYLSHSKLKTIHLGNTLNLKMLNLKSCCNLVEVQMPSKSLKLAHLDLSHSKLKTIHLDNTPNLKTLNLEFCSALVDVQMPAESLKLEHLYLSFTNSKTIHLGSTPNLEELTLNGCNDLVELQMQCVKLKELNIRISKLKTIHLGSTPNLEKLVLNRCNELVELHMPAESLKLEHLDLSNSKLRTLDLGLTPNLKWLRLENCYDLVELKSPAGCLSNLAFLDLSACGSFKSFLFDKQLDSHKVGSLCELHLISEPIDVCALHPDNDSPKFQFSCYYKEDPATSFGNLERLISIGLCTCTNLENFSRSICSLQCIRKLTLEGSITEAPLDLDKLECLEELTFSSTEIKFLPDSICYLKHLKSLKIKSCWLLEKLPVDIGRLESLEKLIVTDCKFLQDIPNSICKIKCINSFDLRGCNQVVELPEEIGSLEGLKELNIEGTGITRLPQSIFKLRGLRIVGSIRLIDTYGLLLKRRRTSDDDERVCYI